MNLIFTVYKAQNLCIHGIKAVWVRYLTTCFNMLEYPLLQHKIYRASMKNLYKMSVRTNMGKKSVSFIATDIWKDLPTHLKYSSRYVCISKEIYTLATVRTTKLMKYATCMVSWFWLGTQHNKGMQGQRNGEQIGVSNEKLLVWTSGLFE